MIQPEFIRALCQRPQNEVGCHEHLQIGVSVTHTQGATCNLSLPHGSLDPPTEGFEPVEGVGSSK